MSTAATTEGGGANADGARRLETERRHHAPQCTERIVDGQTAACLAANSHWTITSARRTGTRGSSSSDRKIAAAAANGRFATTANGSSGHVHRMASACTTRTERNRLRKSGTSVESRSTATTRAPARTSGAVSAPRPAPRSTTKSPRATPASRTIVSASVLLRRKCCPRGPPAGGRRTDTGHHRGHATIVAPMNRA